MSGARIFYETFGDPRKPAIVFIHAGVADRTMWDPQVDALVADYHVVRYDTRGFGKTENSDVAFSDHQDALDLMTALGIDRAVLAGCSRGGKFALNATLDAPARVRGLVWICGGVGGAEFPSDLSDPRDAVEEAMFAAQDAALAAKDWARVVELDVQIWADGLAQPVGRCRAEVREQIRAMCLANIQAAQPEGRPIPLDPPAVGRLGEVRVPTLIVLGKLDLRYTELAAHLLMNSIAGARLLTLPNAAHLPSLEEPAAVNNALREFLAALPG